MTKESINFLL